jgi:hypothetical protein
MKILKTISFFVILLFLSGILFWVFQWEKTEGENPINENDFQKIMGQSQPMREKEPLDSVHVLKTMFTDLEASLSQKGENVVFILMRNEVKLFEKIMPKAQIHQIMCSDLNGDEFPEFWLSVYLGKKVQFYAFEYVKSQMKALRFPRLMGRQNFGYAGNDTLFLEKNYLVRNFTFKNDTFSDIFNGKRSCFYTFGKDQSFTLIRTLDYEK